MALIPKGEHMLRNLREARDEEGFTLIELLVVVIIIGILAAIAIPVFLNQRERAWVSAAESDLRNAAVDMETNYQELSPPAYHADHVNGTNNDTNYTVTTEGSDGVALTVVISDGTVTSAGQAFCLAATHANIESGGTNVAIYDSTAGGLNTTRGATCPAASAL